MNSLLVDVRSGAGRIPESQATDWTNQAYGLGLQTVVGQRLKGGGLRWSPAGADAVCHLRALFESESGQWDAFWHSRAAA